MPLNTLKVLIYLLKIQILIKIYEKVIPDTAGMNLEWERWECKNETFFTPNKENPCCEWMDTLPAIGFNKKKLLNT